MKLLCQKGGRDCFLLCRQVCEPSKIGHISVYPSSKVGLEYTRDFECLSDQPQYIFILLIPTKYKQSHINRSHSIIIYHP